MFARFDHGSFGRPHDVSHSVRRHLARALRGPAPGQLRLRAVDDASKPFRIQPLATASLERAVATYRIGSSCPPSSREPMAEPQSHEIQSVLTENARLPAARGVLPARAHPEHGGLPAAVGRGGDEPGGVLGRPRARGAVLEGALPARCSTGSRRTRAGSSRAAPTWPTTAWTGTCRKRRDKPAILFEGEPGDTPHGDLRRAGGAR